MPRVVNKIAIFRQLSSRTLCRSLYCSRISNCAGRSHREGRARTTRFADAPKWPSILRGGKGISKVVLGHGPARPECKSSEGCTEAGYPPQHLAAPTSRLGIGHQRVTGGLPPPPFERTHVVGHKKARSTQSIFAKLNAQLTTRSTR